MSKTLEFIRAEDHSGRGRSAARPVFRRAWPARQLSFLRRSLAMAELAMIAYNDEAEAQRAAQAIGFPEAQLFDNDGSQAYRFRNEHDVVLACRGTEPTEWNDIKADANAVMSVVGTLGNVHSGFNREVDDLWPHARRIAPRQSAAGLVLRPLARRRDGDDLRLPLQDVVDRQRSAGAAHVRLAARRLQAVHSPRAGDPLPLGPQQRHRHARAARLDGLPALRQRNLPRPLRSDPQAHRRPPQPRPLAGPARRLCCKWRLDLLTDHSIGQYAGHIATAVNEEYAAIAKNGGEVAVDDVVARNGCEESVGDDSATRPVPEPHFRVAPANSAGGGRTLDSTLIRLCTLMRLCWRSAIRTAGTAAMNVISSPAGSGTVGYSNSSSFPKKMSPGSIASRPSYTRRLVIFRCEPGGSGANVKSS